MSMSHRFALVIHTVYVKSGLDFEKIIFSDSFHIYGPMLIFNPLKWDLKMKIKKDVGNLLSSILYETVILKPPLIHGGTFRKDFQLH